MSCWLFAVSKIRNLHISRLAADHKWCVWLWDWHMCHYYYTCCLCPSPVRTQWTQHHCTCCVTMPCLWQRGVAYLKFQRALYFYDGSFLPFGEIVGKEAGVIAHNQHWGPLQGMAHCAESPVCAKESVNGWCAILPQIQGRCLVCLRDLVLSVQHSHKFLWWLGLFSPHQAGTPCDPSSACHTSLVIQ